MMHQVIQLDKGQAVTFASNIRHGGHKVTAGLSSILVGSKACQQQVKQVGVFVYEA
jgi:hypothetical protein